MSCMQITAYGPHVNVRSGSPSGCLIASKLCILPTYCRASLRLASSVSSYRRANTVCVFGGERKAGNGDEDSPWKSLEQAIQGIRKEKSVQDVLREQMQKQEFGGGGGGGIPPSGGDGGGGGRGGGAAEDEGMGGVLDEVLQVFLATVGFIYLYWYILSGDDAFQLIKDIVKFIFTRKASSRLIRIGQKWKKIYEELSRKEMVRKDWLEVEILNTPTWWHDPPRVRRELGRRLGYYK